MTPRKPETTSALLRSKIEGEQSSRAAGRFLWVATLAILLIHITGCSSLVTTYGDSRGSVAKKSLNGFGGLRERFRQAGYETRDVYRFNRRLQDVQTIVWTPRSLTGISNQSGTWLNRWLARGNRTLVLVIPDSGSQLDYHEAVLPLAPAEQRLEYRRLIARSLNQEMVWRSGRIDFAVRPWFTATALSAPRKLDMGDPTKSDVGGNAVQLSPDRDYEWTLDAYDAKAKSAAATATAANVAAGVLNQTPTGPSAPGYQPSVSPYQGGTLDAWEFESLLKVGPDTLVAAVESSSWKDSRIVVVAGGSLLTNYALATEDGRALADKITEVSGEAAGDEAMLAAFATSDYGSIPVREANMNEQASSGMEVLTTWPVSLVTIHGLLAGVVFCLIVFPIFGRPRKAGAIETSHFGGHLDAVATLLARNNGRNYAESRIAEYRRRMSEAARS